MNSEALVNAKDSIIAVCDLDSTSVASSADYSPAFSVELDTSRFDVLPNLYQPPPPSLPNLNASDIEFFQHYIDVASASLSDKPSHKGIWQSNVAEAALPYDFLQHAVISFSASHLAHFTSPNQRSFYENKAVLHRNLALRFSMHALQHVTPANCHALFAFSSIIALSTFALPEPTSANTVCPVDNIVTFLALIKGTSIVLEGGRDWIRAGKFAGLLDHSRFAWRLSACPLPEILRLPFQQLREWNAKTPLSARKICTEAIENLEAAIRAYDMIVDDRTLVFIWCAIVSPEYVALVKRRLPMSLVILAHYAVLLHSVRNQWWSADWGRRIINAVYEMLDEDWKPAVEWPLETVEGKQSPFHASSGFLDVDEADITMSI